jgi:type II secretory pathway predicted ATPase ExeA
MYRQRFGLTGHPLPKNATGKTFFEKIPGYQKLKKRFTELSLDPGLGILTADPGMGKTAAIRNLCAGLPKPNYLVLYLCDTSVSPLDLYRTLALELGVTPSHRRSQLWADIKKALVHLVDERGTQPVVVIDESQHLSDKFLTDLSGFLNFAFDSRDLISLWLVGLPPLTRHLKMQIHGALATRIDTEIHLEALDRETFLAMIEHALKAVGVTQKLLADPALEQLFRASRGVPRQASKILRTALRRAHDREQNFVDETVMDLAIDETLPSTGPT